VKSEESNLIAITTTLKSIVKCEVLSLDESLQTCFNRFFFKECEYVTTNKKVCKILWFISIKAMQLDLQKCII
jgi:hypothetical protein